MKLPVHYYGHPILRTKAKPIEKITPEIVQISQDMIETMVSFENAVGFAGPQLGISLRIFVIREEKMGPDDQPYFAEPEIVINPVLSSPSREIEIMLEGCMSLPGLHVEVLRPETIHISYLNIKGEKIEEDLSDFRARMMMHENDHLNGVLTIDRMDPKERKKIESALRSLKEKYS